MKAAAEQAQPAALNTLAGMPDHVLGTIITGVHCGFDLHAGVTDHLAENEAHAIAITRNMLATKKCFLQQPQLPRQAAPQSDSAPPTTAEAPCSSWEEPLFPPTELRGAHCSLPLSSRLPGVLSR